MARLLRRPPAGTTLPPSGDAGAFRTERAAASATGRAEQIEGNAAVGERGARKSEQPGQAADEGVDLDSAIDSMLAAGGVDAITRVRLGEARRAIAGPTQADDADGFEGASLSGALFRFVMPRLHHPDVLRSDRHRALLEGLADGLADAGEDGVVRSGAMVVHRELRRLALLRAGRNALVEG